MSAVPSLRELQHAFAAAILDPDQASLANWVSGNGLAPRARLQIYRNLVVNNLTGALRTAYPAVEKLVGEDFFDAAAARYIRDFPSRSGNLQDYGAAFAAFLAQMPEAQGLAYLADIARLEWARQQAFLAADAAAPALPALSAMTASEIGRLRFTLHPSLRLVISQHAIWDIWMFCQDDTPEGLKLSSGGQAVALWRDGPRLSMQSLNVGHAQWLATLLAGRSLATAYKQAQTTEADPDLIGGLHWLLDAGLVSEYSTEDTQREPS